MPKFLLNLALPFIIKLIQRWGSQVDLKKARVETESWLRDLIPGSLFDDSAAALADRLFDIVESVLTPDSLEALVRLLAEGNWKAALELLTAKVVEEIKAKGLEIEA